MKLAEYIKRCKCKNINIGAKDGSSFMYCGPKDGIMDIIELFNDYHDNMVNKYPKLSAQYRSFLASNTYDITDDDGLLAYGKKSAQLYTAFSRCYRYLNTYKPILERKVIDFYEKQSENDTMVVLVEGMETGRFWTNEEYVLYLDDRERRSKFDVIFKNKINLLKALPIKEGEKKPAKPGQIVTTRILTNIVEETFDPGFVDFFKDRFIPPVGNKMTQKNAIKFVSEMVTKYKKHLLKDEEEYYDETMQTVN